MAHGKFDRNIFLIPRIFFSLLIFGYASVSFVDDQPYCALRYRRLCQGKGRHVACQYPYPGPGAACENYTQIKFNARLRHFIISYINRRRQRIAAGTERVRGGALIPKPQIMMMVVWDRELALLAQRLADQCSFIHDDCRATVRYPYAGQTVGEVRWRGASGAADALGAQRAVRRVFDAWWGERRRVRPQQLLAPFRLGNKSSAWGHFSQLAVWALAAAGCGAARHGSPHRLLLVCDFSHTNMLGQSTLTAGALARCPARFVRKSRSAYPLLCAPVRVPDQSGDESSGDYGSYEEYVNKFSDDEDVALSGTDYRITNIHDTKEPVKSTNLGKFKNATRPFILDKLDHELEVKTTQNKAAMYQKKLSTRMHFGDVRENNEKNGLKSRFNIIRAKPIHHSVEDITTETSRRKWKHTRQRPRRPGADALISKPAEKMLQRSTGVSLKLDREDMEQLFRDTGYREHWKKPYLKVQ